MSQRDRLVLMTVATLAVLGAVWFSVVGPQRQKAATAGSELSAAKAKLAGAAAQERAAHLAQSSLNTDVGVISQLSRAVPSNLGVSPLLGELQGAAERAGVDFTAVRTGGTGASSTVGAGPASPGGTASAPAPAAGPAPAPAAAGGSTPAGSAAGAPTGTAPGAAGPTGYPTLQLSLIFSGGYLPLTRFLDAVNQFATVHGQDVQVSGRLLSIQSVQVGAQSGGQGGPRMQATVTATAYMLPSGEPSPAALLAALPGAGGTPRSGAVSASSAPAALAQPATSPRRPATAAARLRP